jgi:hypothetical protein
MSGLIRLHELATARGDGLRPELLALLRRRSAIENDPAVIELATARDERSAGLPPTASLSPIPAEGVLRFPSKTPADNVNRERTDDVHSHEPLQGAERLRGSI